MVKFVPLTQENCQNHSKFGFNLGKRGSNSTKNGLNQSSWKWSYALAKELHKKTLMDDQGSIPMYQPAVGSGCQQLGLAVPGSQFVQIFVKKLKDDVRGI